MLLISRPVSASHNLSMVSRLSKNSEVKNCYYMICVKTNLCRRSHPTITESNSAEIHKYANSRACENSMEFLPLDRVQVNRWVADVVPRETSPATRSEGKRLFSQATNNFIYIQLEITGHYEAKRNKTPQNYYNLFPQRPKLQSIVVAQSWIHFHLIKPDQLPGVQSTIIILRREGPGYQWSKMRRVLWEGQTNLSWPVSLFG